MAELIARRPGGGAESSPGHTARCAEYRRAYRERERSLTAAVCCCAEVPESAPLPAETQRNVTMGDMPCVWCLLYISAQFYGDGQVYAEYPGNPAGLDVRSWADAVTAVQSGYVVRDHNGTRCGLNADTLAGGDAVCRGHAVSTLRARFC